METMTASEIMDIMEELGICVDSFTDDIVHGKISLILWMMQNLIKNQKKNLTTNLNNLSLGQLANNE